MVDAPVAGQGLGQIADREGAQRVEQAGRDDLRTEHEHHVGVELLQLCEQRLGRGRGAEVDEHRVKAAGRVLQRALAEVHALADERDAQIASPGTLRLARAVRGRVVSGVVHYSCSATRGAWRSNTRKPIVSTASPMPIGISSIGLPPIALAAVG